MSTEADVQELIDRQRIWECLLRYTRGMDRLDRELALSAYHPGGMEDHGAFIAPYDVFTEQVLGFHRNGETATQHIMSNHSCELDGDVAHAETYVSCYSVTPEGPDSISFGRFIDRLEKRDGRWGIVDRVCVREGSTNFEKNDFVSGFKVEDRSLCRPTRDRTARPICGRCGSIEPPEPSRESPRQNPGGAPLGQTSRQAMVGTMPPSARIAAPLVTAASGLAR